MLNAKAEIPHQKSVLQIKQDDKFFCRLLSKESSNSNPSFRIASSSVAVPFVWESQPGTPKFTFSEDTLPPLTPPPSYHFNTTTNNACKRPVKKHYSRSNNIFMALFTKLNLKKLIMSSPSSAKSSSLPSSLSCSSSFSWWSSSDSSSKVVPMAKIGRRRFLSNGSSSFDLTGENAEDGGSGSPSSTLCFGINPRATSSNSGFQSSFRRQA